MILQQAERCTTALNYMFRDKKIRGGCYKPLRGPRYLSYPVALKNPGDLKTALSIADEVAMGAHVETVMVRRKRGLLYYDFNLPQDYWQSLPFADTNDDIVGIGTGRSKVTFALDDNTPNWLFAGEMGSGKSVAIATALLSLCRQIEHTRLKIGIVDPHQDKWFAPFEKAAHLVAPMARKADEIDKLILWFHNELGKRKVLGQATFEREYNQGQHNMLVLVIDEAARGEVLGSYKNINTRNQELVMDLVQEGRKFKIHVIIGTQKPMENDLPGIFSMIGSRMIGYTQAAHVSKNIDAKPHLLTKKGDFLRVHGSVTRFLWAFPGDDDYALLPRVEGYEPLLVNNSGGAIAITPPIEPPAGRPRTKIDTTIVAAYMTQNISVRKASSELGLGYQLHNRYKEFAMDLSKALKDIQ